MYSSSNKYHPLSSYIKYLKGFLGIIFNMKFSHLIIFVMLILLVNNNAVIGDDFQKCYDECIAKYCPSEGCERGCRSLCARGGPPGTAMFIYRFKLKKKKKFDRGNCIILGKKKMSTILNNTRY